MVTAVERNRYAGARARGRAEAKSPAAVMNARYDRERDCIEMTFRVGVSIAIPRRMIPGLKTTSNATLRAVQVSAAGDELSWRSLNVDVYVPGLVERGFGPRLFTAASR